MRGKVNGGSLRALGPWQQNYYFTCYVFSTLGQLNLLSSLHLHRFSISNGYLSPEKRRETYHIIMGWSSRSNTGRRTSYLRSHAGYSFSCMNREEALRSYTIRLCIFRPFHGHVYSILQHHSSRVFFQV